MPNERTYTHRTARFPAGKSQFTNRRVVGDCEKLRETDGLRSVVNRVGQITKNPTFTRVFWKKIAFKTGHKQ